MERREIRVITLLLLSLFLSAAAATADTMVITYRSGKVQQVALDETSGEVEGIRYLKSPVSESGVKPKENSEQGEGDRKAPSQPVAKKRGVTLKWAPPAE